MDSKIKILRALLQVLTSVSKKSAKSTTELTCASLGLAAWMTTTDGRIARDAQMAYFARLFTREMKHRQETTNADSFEVLKSCFDNTTVVDLYLSLNINSFEDFIGKRSAKQILAVQKKCSKERDAVLKLAEARYSVFAAGSKPTNEGVYATYIEKYPDSYKETKLDELHREWGDRAMFLWAASRSWPEMIGEWPSLLSVDLFAGEAKVENWSKLRRLLGLLKWMIEVDGSFGELRIIFSDTLAVVPD